MNTDEWVENLQKAVIRIKNKVESLEKEDNEITKKVNKITKKISKILRADVKDLATYQRLHDEREELWRIQDNKHKIYYDLLRCLDTLETYSCIESE